MTSHTMGLLPGYRTRYKFSSVGKASNSTTRQMIIFTSIISLHHQWTCFVWQTSIIACRVQHGVRPLLPLSPLNASIHPVVLAKLTSRECAIIFLNSLVSICFLNIYVCKHRFVLLSTFHRELSFASFWCFMQRRITVQIAENKWTWTLSHG